MENEEDFLMEKADAEWQKQEEQEKRYDEHEKYLESLSEDDVDDLLAEDAERKKQNRLKWDAFKNKSQSYDPYKAYKFNND